MNPPPLSPPQRGTWRRKRIVLATVLLAVVLPFFVVAIWYVSYRVGNTRAIERLEAKARKRGEPLTLAELAAKHPPILDAENAAIPLLELWESEDPPFWGAFLAGQRPLPERIRVTVDPKLPILGTKAARVPRSELLPSAALAAAEAYLKSQASHMDAVRLALRRPRCRFPIQITDGFNALLPHLSVVKSEAQHFRLEALVATERGDVDAAITSLTNVARLGQLLAEEPFLIGALVRIACLSMVIDDADRLLARRELSTAQLTRLDTLFEGLKPPGHLRAAFASERASALSLFDSPSETVAQLGAMDGDSGDGVNPTAHRAGIGLMTAIGLAAADRRLMLETYDVANELADEDTPKALDRSQQVFKEAQAKARKFPPKIFSGLMLGSSEKVPVRFASLEARRRAAVTAVAVLRHRLAHAGALPERLEDLVPQHLVAVPADPFDGQPLRYRRLNPGFVVYSTGADLEDNDGLERTAKKSDKIFDETFVVGR